jgi:hypothetical protein
MDDAMTEEEINDRAYKLWQVGEFEAGFYTLEALVESKDPYTTFNRSIFHLGFGMWPKGWEMYRARQLVSPYNVGKRAGTFFQRVQKGTNIEQCWAESIDDIIGKDLFFFHEQGLGDTIQFVRYAKQLCPLVNSLTIAVPPVLGRLFRALEGDFKVVTGENPNLFSHCQVSTPMMDAPALLKTTVNTIPPPIPINIKVHHELLGGKGRPRIGLVWKGAAPLQLREDSIDNRRSMTFEQIRPLLSQNQFQFVSLQMPDQSVVDDRLWQPILSNFDLLDTAGIISQLDLIITIDSSICHLAATIGKPVWMLSRFDQCWRWFWDGRTTSPWYPSLTIFQQKSPGDWSEVIERVAHSLRNLT